MRERWVLSFAARWQAACGPFLPASAATSGPNQQPGIVFTHYLLRTSKDLRILLSPTACLRQLVSGVFSCRLLLFCLLGVRVPVEAAVFNMSMDVYQ